MRKKTLTIYFAVDFSCVMVQIDIYGSKVNLKNTDGNNVGGGQLILQD